jgi:hypothetical protein
VAKPLVIAIKGQEDSIADSVKQEFAVTELD